MARIITVDFTGVESGSRFARVPAGDYHLKLVEVKGKKGGDSSKPYLASVFEIQGPKKKGTKLAPHSFSLQKQSLWNLRNFLEAAGKQTPAKALKIDLDKMIGLECAATLIDDEPYEGKIKSIISAFFPLDDLGSTSEDGTELEEAFEENAEEETEEEEAPKKTTKKTAKKSKKKEEPEEEPEEEEESTEEEDLFS